MEKVNKFVFNLSSQLLYGTLFSSTQYLVTYLKMHVETHVGLHEKCPLLSEFNKNWHVPTNFSKTPFMSSCMKIHPAVLELLHADRQMDRHGTASRHIFASFIL
jgi:hypothetical protein